MIGDIHKLRFILIIGIVLLVTGYYINQPSSAATDTYLNFVELSAAEEYGIDYKIESRDTSSPISVIAIHGGGIEKGTTELARAVSNSNNYTYYSFIGLKSSGNSILHITSNNFDEPIAVSLVGNSKYTVSIHGYSGTDKVTYIGGLDTDLGRLIKKNLISAGFAVKPAPDDIAGTSKNNIANRNLSGKGVQLELTRGLRDSFFNGYGVTNNTLSKYANAVNKAIISYNP